MISDTTDIEDETKNEDAQSAYDVEQITNENRINEVTESNKEGKQQCFISHRQIINMFRVKFLSFSLLLWFYVQLAYAGLFYSIFINLSRASSSLVVKVSMIKEKLYSIMYVYLYLYINSR